jgi:hypothetical protein
MASASTTSSSSGRIWGIVAEYDGPSELIQAAEALRRAGYRRFDAHSPFPIHGMNRAIGVRGSLVPWLVLAGGLAGGTSGLLLQYWIHVIDYPLVFSGKPFFSVPAFIPVTFELTILLAALGAMAGILIFNLIPMLYHPLFSHERFTRVTSDGFFVSVEARDPRFEPDGTRRLLESLGGHHIALLEP